MTMSFDIIYNTIRQSKTYADLLIIYLEHVLADAINAGFSSAIIQDFKSEFLQAYTAGYKPTYTARNVSHNVRTTYELYVYTKNHKTAGAEVNSQIADLINFVCTDYSDLYTNIEYAYIRDNFGNIRFKEYEILLAEIHDDKRQYKLLNDYRTKMLQKLYDKLAVR